MRGVGNRNLVVVPRFVIEVRKWKQIQQSTCLRANLVFRDDVSRKRQSRRWIDQLHRLAKWSDTLRKIARALCRGRHPSGQSVGISILSALIAKEKRRGIVSDQMRNAEGAADIKRTSKPVISRLCCVLSG